MLKPSITATVFAVGLFFRRPIFTGLCLIGPVFLGPILSAECSASEPYVPADDAVVLETLSSSLFKGRNELVELRKSLAKHPRDVPTATRTANRFLAMGSEDGDPRFFGYARAALTPWWDSAEPPGPILAIRAKLKEKEHRYQDALADQRLLVTREPRNAQALIEIANLHRVLGDYDQAFNACAELEKFSDSLPVTLCRAPLQAVTGQADQAYKSLIDSLPEAQANWPTTVKFIRTMLAQIAQATGRPGVAEEHYAAGLKQSPADSYLLRAYGDLLLDEGRNEDALSLLIDHVDDNGILLRAAIAARRIDNVNVSTQWQRELESRFAETRLRGGEPHGRFEARYLLELRGEPEAALRVALANWKKQKETRDSRILLEAALIAKRPSAASSAISFLQDHGTEDIHLSQLIQQLEQVP